MIRNDNHTLGIGIALILIVTIMTYTPVFQADFIEFDDPQYVTKNDWVKAGITWDGIRWAFTQYDASNWHPLTWLSHMLDCEIYGMNASGHHFTSLILHIANSILLYVFFFQVTRAPYKSLALGLLFALHPLHVESVAWISERKDVLSTFFGLLCILAYTLYLQDFEKKYYGFMFLSLCLSLMCKSMLATMPILLIILDIWPLQRYDGNRFKDKWLLFIPVIPSCLNTYFAQLEGQSINSFAAISFTERILNAIISMATYIFKTIWPHNLSFLYPYPEQISVWMAIFCLVMLLFFLITGILIFSHSPYFLTGILWFFVALMPVVGIIQIGTQSMADRYTYIPHIGLFWAIIWTFSSFFKTKKFNYILYAVFCLVLFGMACKTYHQTQFWKKGELLFRQAIKNTKNNYIAHNNLGACLTNSIDSIAHFNRSIEINPKNMLSYINKGKCLLSMGRIEEATMIYQSVLEDAPDHAHANMALAELYYHQNQLKKALKCYYHALKTAPKKDLIYFNIARIFQESGNLIESQFFYIKALELNPVSPDMHFEYGHLLIALKQFPKAIFHFKCVIDLNPNYTKAHQHLSRLYMRNRQFKKALYHQSIAQKLPPKKR